MPDRIDLTASRRNELFLESTAQGKVRDCDTQSPARETRALPGKSATLTSWHDFTNIKAKRFSPPADSRFRAAVPLRPRMKLSPSPKNLLPVRKRPKS